ncbi:hypothetical protein ACLKA6_018798 [Drosophila palustris]
MLCVRLSREEGVHYSVELVWARRHRLSAQLPHDQFVCSSKWLQICGIAKALGSVWPLPRLRLPLAPSFSFGRPLRIGRAMVTIALLDTCALPRDIPFGPWLSPHSTRQLGDVGFLLCGVPRYASITCGGNAICKCFGQTIPTPVR